MNLKNEMFLFYLHMNAFPYLWLLFNTTTGRFILGIFIVYLIIRIFGWWLVPIIAVIAAIILLHEYYSQQKFLKNYKDITDEARELYDTKNKTKLIAGIILLAVALAFVIGIVYTNYAENKRYSSPRSYAPYQPQEELIDTRAYEPDIIETDKVETKQPVKSNTYTPSSNPRSYSTGYYSDDVYDDEDNMRGFDPISEDVDDDDNGMTEYMEANDDEGYE